MALLATSTLVLKKKSQTAFSISALCQDNHHHETREPLAGKILTNLTAMAGRFGCHTTCQNTNCPVKKNWQLRHQTLPHFQTVAHAQFFCHTFVGGCLIFAVPQSPSV
eukprot:g38045.t1